VEKNKEDASLNTVWVALGVVAGAVLMVPITQYMPWGLVSTFETNGQIGDFVGGLLNPVIAMLAFVWLRKGVRLQQTELVETRKSLAETAASQAAQAKIAAVTALIQLELAFATDIEKRIEELQSALVRAQNDLRSADQSYLMRMAITGQKPEPQTRIDRIEEDITVEELNLIDVRKRRREIAEKLSNLAVDYL
jgi:hypothetical protein